MASVLLIRPLCEGDEQEFAEPLGIERLAAYLRSRGIDEVRIADRRLGARKRQADLSLEDDPACTDGPRSSSSAEPIGFFEVLREAYPDGAAPDLVGFSLMTQSDVPDARRIASRLSAWWPEARFVAGGVFVTTSPEQAKRMLPSRFTLLRGEGEVALLRMALECRYGGEVPAASGVVPSACSPDEWAIPYRPNLVDYARLGCAVNMQTSRGCKGACAFCATPSLPEDLRRWRPRSLELVVDEMQRETARLENVGLPPIFNFVDDDFGPIERLEALADELDARQMRVAFACEMRYAALCHQGQLALRLERLHRAGLTRVFFGIESLDPKTLQRWRKPMDLEALPEVLSAFRQTGITVQPGYILWHADQTVEGALHEVHQLHELGIYSHRAALSRLIAFPGCALAPKDVDAAGFQMMGDEEEAFYRRFSRATQDLMGTWMQAAISEPYASAKAFLAGNHEPCKEIQKTLEVVNERSFALFVKMCS